MGVGLSRAPTQLNPQLNPETHEFDPTHVEAWLDRSGEYCNRREVSAILYRVIKEALGSDFIAQECSRGVASRRRGRKENTEVREWKVSP
jgi:hypothetical protein